MRQRPFGGSRRRTFFLAVGALVAAMVGSGCSAPEEVVVTVISTPGATSQVTVPSAGPGGTATTAAPSRSTGPTVSSSLNLANAIRIASTPKFGSKNVPPNDPMTVTVFAGKIKTIAVTADDGTPISGKVSKDKATWTLAQRLNYNTKITVNGTAVASNGATKPIKGSITTVNPVETVRASFQRPIANGETVGVATPIILTFFSPIQDKAAAQRALKVTTDKGEVQGSWGWLQDEDTQNNGTVVSQVHFRPKEYWPGYTKVHVEADLRGVDYGNGWGREDISADFKIGRDQRVEADVNTKQLIVFRDGQIVENYPVSYGKESEPGRTTVSGIHVITDKYPEFKMTNPQFGYFDVPEKWAVRINNNGEFIHNNEAVEKAGLLGFQNVSHGCVNMGLKDSIEFYKSSIYGDPVDVKGTSQKMSEKDFIYDWKYSWEEWKELSRLNT